MGKNDRTWAAIMAALGRGLSSYSQGYERRKEREAREQEREDTKEHRDRADKRADEHLGIAQRGEERADRSEALQKKKFAYQVEQDRLRREENERKAKSTQDWREEGRDIEKQRLEQLKKRYQSDEEDRQRRARIREQELQIKKDKAKAEASGRSRSPTGNKADFARAANKTLLDSLGGDQKKALEHLREKMKRTPKAQLDEWMAEQLKTSGGALSAPGAAPEMLKQFNAKHRDLQLQYYLLNEEMQKQQQAQALMEQPGASGTAISPDRVPLMREQVLQQGMQNAQMAQTEQSNIPGVTQQDQSDIGSLEILKAVVLNPMMPLPDQVEAWRRLQQLTGVKPPIEIQAVMNGQGMRPTMPLMNPIR